MEIIIISLTISIILAVLSNSIIEHVYIRKFINKSQLIQIGMNENSVNDIFNYKYNYTRYSFLIENNPEFVVKYSIKSFNGKNKEMSDVIFLKIYFKNDLVYHIERGNYA